MHAIVLIYLLIRDKAYSYFFSVRFKWISTRPKNMVGLLTFANFLCLFFVGIFYYYGEILVLLHCDLCLFSFINFHCLPCKSYEEKANQPALFLQLFALT